MMNAAHAVEAQPLNLAHLQAHTWPTRTAAEDFNPPIFSDDEVRERFAGASRPSVLAMA
jgi:hypothetical protein